MNNLKQYAGLLNDEAPEDHFLAYITPSERDMLVDAGGVKTPTPSGIFAYPPGMGDPNYDGSGGGNYGGSGGNKGDGGNNNRERGAERNRTQSTPTKTTVSKPSSTNNPNFTGGDANKGTIMGGSKLNNATRGDGGGDDIDSTYTSTSFDVTPKPVEKSLPEKIVDFIKGGGIIGNAIKAIGGALGIAKENKYAGITGEDGYGEGDYISNQGDWAVSKGLVDKAEDYFDLDLEEQQAIDKQMYDDGVRSKAFNDLYEGDLSQVNNLTSTEREAVNSIIPDVVYEVGGTKAQPSMVNKYFANNSNNLGISQNFMTSYDQAKADLAKKLNMTTNANQFGYNANMSASNIYYNYLKEQGLI